MEHVSEPTTVRELMDNHRSERHAFFFRLRTAPTMRCCAKRSSRSDPTPPRRNPQNSPAESSHPTVSLTQEAKTKTENAMRRPIQGVGKVGGWGCLSWFDGGVVCR